MSSRRSARRWILSLLAIAALVALWICSLFLRAHRILDHHRQETRTFLGTFPAAAADRPAIFDPSESGEAWALEMDALHRFDDQYPVGDDPPSFHRFVSFEGATFTLEDGDEKMERVERANLLLDQLRRAFRRTLVLPTKRPGWSTSIGIAELVSTLRHSATLRHAEGNDLAAMERLVLSWGLAQDLARHGDRDPRDKLWHAEAHGALVAKTVLESHSLSARDLETVAVWLDRLAKARPPLSRAIEVDDALERSFIADPDAAPGIFISDAIRPPEPTWREFWSSTIHDAKRVLTIARAAEGIRGVEALPTWERAAAACRRLEAMELSACDPWELPDELSFRLEARTQTYMAMLRLAVAVAWYDAEHDGFPVGMDVLVPRYLRTLEPCPSTGRPFLHENGLIWFEYAPDPSADAWDATVFSPSTAQWRIGRKPK